MNSRAKGARGEREFIARYLTPFWPEAKRNLDQFSDDKRDVAKVAGVHFQIKRTERLELWAAIRQAEQEAMGSDVPVVAFRRNRSGWYCVLDAGTFVATLASSGLSFFPSVASRAATPASAQADRGASSVVGPEADPSGPPQSTAGADV